MSGTSAFVQLASGLNIFMARPRARVFGPRSFWYTTPSWLTMKVITPETPYCDTWSSRAIYTGTHDNPTTRGWYDGLPEASRRRLWRYLRRTTGESREVAPALLGLAWSSASALAIAPFQDVLNLGDEARMNVPGRAEGNWRWRCTADTLSPAAFESLRELTTSSSRPGSRRAPLRERAASVAS